MDTVGITTGRANRKRGLDSLMPSISVEDITSHENLRSIQISELRVSPQQPRRYFDPKAIQTLAQSMRIQGFKSVIVVRPKDGKYEIVAGERRFRAAQLAELKEVMCLVEDLDDEQAYQFALDENLNREDLSKLEEVEGILELISIKHGTSPEHSIAVIRTEGHPRKQAGGNVSTSIELTQIKAILKLYDIKLETFRSTYLPLLDLPKELKQAHLNGSLGYNHVLELAKLKDDTQRDTLLKEAIQHKYSVRKLKEQVRAALKGSNPKTIKIAGQGPPPAVVKAWKELCSTPRWNDSEFIELVHSTIQHLLNDRANFSTL